MLVGILLAPFSADTFDDTNLEVKYNYGWLIVVVVLANVIVNQLVMLITLIINLKGKILKAWAKIKEHIEKCR